MSLVVSLVITPLLMGEFIATSQLRYSFDSALVDAKMDIRVSNFYRFLDLSSDIAKIDGVKKISYVLTRTERSIILATGRSSVFPDYNKTRPVLLTSFEPSFWKGNLSIIEGLPPSGDGEVALSQDISALLNVDIGDKLNVTSPYGNFQKEYKVVGIFTVNGLLERLLYGYDLIESDFPLKVRNKSLEFIGLLWFTFNESISGNGLSSVYSTFPTFLIWFDSSMFFNPWNPNIMYEEIKSIDNRIIYEATKYVPIVSIRYFNYILEVLENYSNWPSALKLQLTYAILPGIFVAGITSTLIGWTYVNRRKHEIALFRIRGMKSLTLYKTILWDFISVSIVGSLIGYLISLLFMVLAAYLFYPFYTLRYGVIDIILRNVYNYLITALAFGGAFGFFSVIPTTIYAMKIPITEGLKGYLEEVEKEPRPSYTIIVLALGLYALFESYFGLYVLNNVALKFMFADTALTQVLGVLLFVIDIFLVGMGPFLLAYSLSRLIAYFAANLKGLLEKISNLFAQTFSTIIVSHFIRRPARTARLIFVTTLIMSFMLTASVNSSTNMNEVRNYVKAKIGSDYMIDILSGPKNVEFWENQLVNEIKSISNNVKPLTCYYMFKPISLGLPYAYIIGVDPDYFGGSFITTESLQGLTVKGAREYLINTSKALLSISAYEKYGFRKGDQIKLKFSYMGETETVEIDVVGFIEFAPGLLSDIFALQKEDYLIIIVNKELIKDYVQIPYRILIDSSGDMNDVKYINELANLFLKYSIYADIYSYKLALKFISRESISGLMINVFKTQFFELAIITAFSIYVILSAEYMERRKELAIMLSRGAKPEHVSKIAEAEALLIILTSIITSVLIAWGFSYTLLEMVTYGLIGSFKPPPGHGVTFTLDSLFTVLLEGVVVYLSAIIAMRIALKVDLAKETREYSLW